MTLEHRIPSRGVAPSRHTRAVRGAAFGLAHALVWSFLWSSAAHADQRAMGEPEPSRDAAMAPPPAAELETSVPWSHSHNDYRQRRPLRDALSHGFISVEADVFLVDGDLLVAHDRAECVPGRTLRVLYLEPLARRARERGGVIYRQGASEDRGRFWLLIDIKSGGEPAYRQIEEQLAAYPDVFTSWHEGVEERRAVTVVISGNVPRAAIAAMPRRRVAIDGRLHDLEPSGGRPLPVGLVPWVSAPWLGQFTWLGHGQMPHHERARLDEIVRKAHERGHLLRFWGVPNVEAVWRTLREAGVDLINIDHLANGARVLRELERESREE
ncbi:MAG: phosphatidylinositol-specific phospholipase C/glycerophosphodiester phosphodiesterase family protein [Phycisphaeraceae bacterium]|nr:phosphatidylinositol-specific phospholipase C/glycerophosphodiester phosphodiesterase family protein [Phycisphaeraceae bacterium]